MPMHFRAALREDPDVILVGEMRDLDTIATAVTAAETGHLVFSTLHTIGAAATIDRYYRRFPAASAASRFVCSWQPCWNPLFPGGC